MGEKLKLDIPPRPHRQRHHIQHPTLLTFCTCRFGCCTWEMLPVCARCCSLGQLANLEMRALVMQVNLSL